MSVQCPTCGGSGVIEADTSASAWEAARASGGLVDGGQRYRIEWRPGRKIKRALFRVCTDDRVATLQHVRTIVVQQRGETRCVLDDDAQLSDVPEVYLAKMRDDGFTPAAEVAARV